MIKKIFWTIILLVPLTVGLTIGLSGSTNVVAKYFDTSNIIGNWNEWFNNTDWGLLNNIHHSEDVTWWEWTKMALMLIWVLFWTAPLWYAWKGTFFVGWVPLVGFTLRIGLLLLLLFLPQALVWIQNATHSGTWADDASGWLSSILIIVALLGLWVKS